MMADCRANKVPRVNRVLLVILALPVPRERLVKTVQTVHRVKMALTATRLSVALTTGQKLTSRQSKAN